MSWELRERLRPEQTPRGGRADVAGAAVRQSRAPPRCALALEPTWRRPRSPCRSKASTATRRRRCASGCSSAPRRGDGVARARCASAERLVAARALAGAAPARSWRRRATRWRSPRRCRSRGSTTTAPGGCASGAAGRARGRARVARGGARRPRPGAGARTRLARAPKVVMATLARRRRRRAWPMRPRSPPTARRRSTASRRSTARGLGAARDARRRLAVDGGQVAGPAGRRRARRGADRAPARRAPRTVCRCSSTPRPWRCGVHRLTARPRAIEPSRNHQEDRDVQRHGNEVDCAAQRAASRWSRLRAAVGGASAAADTDPGALGRSRLPAAAGAMLPWKTGNTWTYLVNDEGVVSTKETTIGEHGAGGGDGAEQGRHGLQGA